MNKQNMKNILKMMIFLCLVITLLHLSSRIVEPKQNTKESGIKYENARGFYGERQNSLDIIAIGNSDLYNAMNPLQLWHEQGIPSYVCAEPSQKIVEAYSLLKQTYLNQTPQLIILEVDELFTKSDVDDLDISISETLKEIFPVFDYHNRWKNIQKDDFIKEKVYNQKILTKGYKYYNNVQSYKGGKSYLKNKKKSSLTYTTQYYLHQFIKYAKNNGSQVLLMCCPTANTWTMDKHHTIQKIADQYQLQFLDFNMLLDDINFDWTKDTRDGGNHLNDFGAQKVTHYLGNYLKLQYHFQDYRTHQDYQNWNQDYLEYHQKLKYYKGKNGFIGK